MLSTMEFGKKKYVKQEQVLQKINKKCVSLSDNELVKRNSEILKEVVKNITDTMKRKDPLFKLLFTTIFYGGSYFDGIKISEPTEYDLDLLLVLPVVGKPTVEATNMPGFAYVKLEDFERMIKQPENKNHERTLRKFVDDKYYVLTCQVYSWMEGLLQKSLLELPFENGKYVLNVSKGKLLISFHKSGPALTLKISGKDIKLDVDLVPCFSFTEKQWPIGNYRQNPCPNKTNFFVVPKKPKQVPGKIDRYWRLSFQEQERELLKKDNRTFVKPAIRLLKRLRDVQGHDCIASYYIKTVFLWEIMDSNSDTFNYSLSYAFMKMLHILKKSIEEKRILNFWNKKNNLLEYINESTLANIANKLKNIIKDIDNHLDQPETIEKYLVTVEDENEGCDSSNWLESLVIVAALSFIGFLGSTQRRNLS